MRETWWISFEALQRTSRQSQYILELEFINYFQSPKVFPFVICHLSQKRKNVTAHSFFSSVFSHWVEVMSSILDFTWIRGGRGGGAKTHPPLSKNKNASAQVRPAGCIYDVRRTSWLSPS
jgi:hypothetical protein